MNFYFLQHKKFYFYQFLLIWTLCIFGNIFLVFLSKDIHELPPVISILSFLFFCLLFGLITYLGIKLVIKTDLNSLKHHKFFKTDLLPALTATAVALASIYILNRTLIKIPFEDMTFLESSAFWTKIFSSFYSGINEEVFLRLFFLPFVYYLLTKVIKEKRHKKTLIWIAILLAAAFPLSLNFISLDNFEKARSTILNLVYGTIFGYLFVYKSFYSAVIAHFFTEFLMNGI